MFNRYWREYPGWMQLLQFIILLMISVYFFAVLASKAVVLLTGVSQEAITNVNTGSPANVINAVLFIQFISAVGIFLFPALVFAYFTHPRPAKYLGIVKPRKPFHIVLAACIMLGALPMLSTIAGWIGQLDLGETVKAAQSQNDRIMNALLTISSPVQLVLTFIVLAILPGLSEELFFRGIIMRSAARKSPFVFYPIILSAFVFALMHGNVNGLMSIFFGGLLLGSIYYLTGSLWCSIFAHMVYNGVQVYFSYLATTNTAMKAFAENNSVPLEYNIAGTIVFAVSLYLLWKTRTPLAPNWADDFDEGEVVGDES